MTKSIFDHDGLDVDRFSIDHVAASFRIVEKSSIPRADTVGEEPATYDPGVDYEYRDAEYEYEYERKARTRLMHPSGLSGRNQMADHCRPSG